MDYKKKEVFFIIGTWIIFLGIPYLFSYLDIPYKDILVNSWWIYALLLIATFFYFCNPETVRNVICRICEKKIEDVIGVPSALGTRDNKDIKEFKEEIKKPEIKVVDDSEEIIKIKSQDSDLIQLSKDFADGKYEKIILDVTNKLKSDKSIDFKKEYFCRVFMEFAFSIMSTNQYVMDDRIENLKSIIDSKQAENKTILMKFMIMLSQCYLQQNKLSEALEVSYKTLYKIKKDKKGYSSEILALFYHLQARIFISLDQPIQAIIVAKEGLKFADDENEADLYHLISSTYFNCLNNTKQALLFALKSWAKIYPNAKYLSSLVYICYFSYFFEGQYQEAAEFLENYTVTEKTNKYFANLSYLLYKTGQFEKAKEYAEKALEYEKDRAVAAKNTLAMLAMDAQNYERAIYLFSEILPNFAEDKDSRYGKYFYSEILYNRGKCYAELGNYTKANDDINTAMKLGFENIDARLFEEIQYNVINNKIEDTKLITDKTEKEDNNNA